MPAGMAAAAFPALPTASAKPLSLEGSGADTDMGLVLRGAMLAPTICGLGLALQGCQPLRRHP